MRFLLSFLLLSFLSLGSAQEFSLDDFYDENSELEEIVTNYFNALNDTSRVGQMIVPATGRLGKSRTYVADLASKGWIGGILLLNGTVDIFTQDVKNFDSINDNPLSP